MNKVSIIFNGLTVGDLEVMSDCVVWIEESGYDTLVDANQNCCIVVEDWEARCADGWNVGYEVIIDGVWLGFAVGCAFK